MAITAGEYGTFSGSFRLPETGLTGEFSLEDTETDGQVSFNVEEYKRPSFYVEYKKIDREYRLNDTVTATGMALGYAGNSMDGAKVRYRVTRIARFPFPWLYRGIGFPRSQSMEITQGETETDKDGLFRINFKAIPDKNIDKTTLPVFEYRVNADITDISGETRSGETYVSIGYHTLNLEINLPEEKIFPNDKLAPYWKKCQESIRRAANCCGQYDGRTRSQARNDSYGNGTGTHRILLYSQQKKNTCSISPMTNMPMKPKKKTGQRAKPHLKKQIPSKAINTSLRSPQIN